MLIGLLVDVSGSMKEKLQLSNVAQSNNSEVTRAESIFKTIIRIAENKTESERLSSQEIFFLAFGLDPSGPSTCDFLGLLENLDQKQINNYLLIFI